MFLQSETTKLLKMCGKIRASDRMEEVGTAQQQHQHKHAQTTTTRRTAKFEPERERRQSLFLSTLGVEKL